MKLEEILRMIEHAEFYFYKSEFRGVEEMLRLFFIFHLAIRTEFYGID